MPGPKGPRLVQFLAIATAGSPGNAWRVGEAGPAIRLAARDGPLSARRGQFRPPVGPWLPVGEPAGPPCGQCVHKSEVRDGSWSFPHPCGQCSDRIRGHGEPLWPDRLCVPLLAQSCLLFLPQETPPLFRAQPHRLAGPPLPAALRGHLTESDEDCFHLLLYSFDDSH